MPRRKAWRFGENGCFKSGRPRLILDISDYKNDLIKKVSLVYDDGLAFSYSKVNP